MKPRPIGRPATGLPRYYMDCGWYRHPRFAGLPVETLFTFEAIVGYCTHHGTDGECPADVEDLAAVLGVRLSVVRKAVPLLLDRGALDRSGSSLDVRGWSEHNPTAAEVASLSDDRREAAVYGNHVRHHVQKGVRKDGCRFCEIDPPDASPPDHTCDHTCDHTGDHKPLTNGSHGMGWDGKENPQPPPVPTSVAAPEGAEAPPPAVGTPADRRSAAAPPRAPAAPAPSPRASGTNPRATGMNPRASSAPPRPARGTPEAAVAARDALADRTERRATGLACSTCDDMGVVETPAGAEVCDCRRQLQAALTAHHAATQGDNPRPPNPPGDHR